MLKETDFRWNDGYLMWSWPPAPGDTVLTISCCNGLNPDEKYGAELTLRKREFSVYMDEGWELPRSVPRNIPLLFQCREMIPGKEVNSFLVRVTGEAMIVGYWDEEDRNTRGLRRITVHYPRDISCASYPEGMLKLRFWDVQGTVAQEFELPKPADHMQTVWYEISHPISRSEVLLADDKQMGEYRIKDCFRLQRGN